MRTVKSNFFVWVKKRTLCASTANANYTTTITDDNDLRCFSNIDDMIRMIMFSIFIIL